MKPSPDDFTTSRRGLFAGAGGIALAAGLTPIGAATRAELQGAQATTNRAVTLDPGAVSTGLTYLDSGTVHPMPVGARAAVDRYVASRADGGEWPTYEIEGRAKERFATLVGADPDELAFVQSTTAGEQLVVDALGIPESGGSIVTDTLHFFGSFWLYEQLAERGTDVRWLRPREGRIDLTQYDRAITDDTRLVSLSLVSTYNGFEQDLAAVCEIAHARGAMVYADIIHAAGTVPVDLHASGVDFAATASYKWLMGDFGLGFLYVRRDRLADLRRPRFGYYQLGQFQSHVYPFDPPGESVADMAPREGAEGYFAMGTRSHSVMAQLEWSLGHLLELGVDNLMDQRRPWLARLHEALPAKGYTVVTPPETRSPLLTCVLEGAYDRLSEPLERAGVKITLSRNRFRICPSFFNTADDIEQLIDALPHASSLG